MTNLSQVVALVKGRKTAIEKLLGSANQIFQKADLFTGLSKTFRPTDESEPARPPERKLAQHNVASVLETFRNSLVESLNTVRTQDSGNCFAKGSISVDDRGTTLNLKDIPATHLLFLEHQMNDLRTLVGNIPTLDPAYTWTKNANTGFYETEKEETSTTRKVQRPLVMYPATPEHPAQTQLVNEDIRVGIWSSIKTSGAIPVPVKQEMLRRITLLQEAIIKAREEANRTAVTFESEEGKSIVDFIFGA